MPELSDPMRKSLPLSQHFFSVLAEECLDGFDYTFVRILGGASHIFLYLQVTLTKGVRLKSQHPAMFRLSTLGRSSVEPALRHPERHPPTSMMTSAP